MEILGQHHDPNKWGIFTDSPKMSCSIMETYIPSVPTSRAIYMNKSCDNMHHLVKHIQHDKYSGHVSRDLKAVMLLLENSKNLSHDSWSPD
jgi:hypothetical protein